MLRKLDPPSHLCEKCVIRTDADVGARLDLGSALPHDDGPASDKLPGESFYAKPLCI